MCSTVRCRTLFDLFFLNSKTPTYTHSVEWIHTNKNVLLKQNHFQLWTLSQPGGGLMCGPPVCLPEGALHHLKNLKKKKTWSELQDLTGEWKLGLNVSWRFQHLHYLKLRYKSRCFFFFFCGRGSVWNHWVLWEAVEPRTLSSVCLHRMCVCVIRGRCVGGLNTAIFCR